MPTNTILASFFLGILSAGSPCVLPLYPGFLAYLSGERAGLARRRGRYFLGLFVLGGVLSMMVMLGGLIALLSISVGRALTFLLPLADILILILGALLLLNINPFNQLPQVRVPVLSHPFVNAFLYGLLYGPIALPCSGPLVVGIFALSLTIPEAFSKLALFLWFGLGFGLPLLILSFLAGASQRWITRFFAQHSRAINIAGGILLLGVGAFDLVQNWQFIRLMIQ